MRPKQDRQIGASADGLVHEYMHNRGVPPAAWQGPIFQISKSKYLKPSLSFTRPAHRNPDTPHLRLAPHPPSHPRGGFFMLTNQNFNACLRWLSYMLASVDKFNSVDLSVRVKIKQHTRQSLPCFAMRSVSKADICDVVLRGVGGVHFVHAAFLSGGICASTFSAFSFSHSRISRIAPGTNRAITSRISG